jgi:hypothetical protein
MLAPPEDRRRRERGADVRAGQRPAEARAGSTTVLGYVAAQQPTVRRAASSYELRRPFWSVK